MTYHGWKINSTIIIQQITFFFFHPQVNILVLRAITSKWYNTNRTLGSLLEHEKQYYKIYRENEREEVDQAVLYFWPIFKRMCEWETKHKAFLNTQKQIRNTAFTSL